MTGPDFETRRDRAVQATLQQRQLSSSQARRALHDAYEVTYKYFGPFVVEMTGRMLDDMRADVERDSKHRVAFIGRDGHSLALAAQQLDKRFFDRHCSEIVLSRVSVEAALQDLERNGGASFPALRNFRQTAGRVDASKIDGAFGRLDAYLMAHGLPVGREGSAVTVVDHQFSRGRCRSCWRPCTPRRGSPVGTSPSAPRPTTRTREPSSARPFTSRPMRSRLGDPCRKPQISTASLVTPTPLR